MNNNENRPKVQGERSGAHGYGRSGNAGSRPNGNAGSRPNGNGRGKPGGRAFSKNGRSGGGVRKYTPKSAPESAAKPAPKPVDMSYLSDARLAASRSLDAWYRNGKYTNLEIDSYLNKCTLSDADRGLYTALVYGVTERLVTLDYIIAAYSSRKVSEIENQTMWALRLGVYQLVYMDRIPPHAAVSESVRIAGGISGGFVNGILRTFLRAGCAIPMPSESDTVTYLSVKYSVPAPLCRFWLNIYGRGGTVETLLADTLHRTPVTLRVNTLRHTPSEVLDALASSGTEAEISPYCGDVISLKASSPLTDGIGAGLYFVQDTASRLAVSALDAKPGDTVIDVCAAPGGKSVSCALDMDNRGRVYSFDLHENKLSLIRRMADLMGIDIITASSRDGRTPDESLIGKADRVICDVPCSGLGVIAKKPDIKYKNPDELTRLPDVQYAILSASAAYVKAGGMLLYSTCTLNPHENGGVVDKFLAEHPQFKPCDFVLADGKLKSDRGSLTLTPHEHGTDGFFMARLVRTEGTGDTEGTEGTEDTEDTEDTRPF